MTVKKQIKLKSFSHWSPSFQFLFFPLVLLGLFSLTAFILTSFWKYDWWLAEFFAQGMKYEVVKYWVQIYSVIGDTELIVVLFLFIAILVETFYKKQIEKKSNGFYSKNRWLISLAYFLAISGWIAWGIYEIISYRWKDRGFGPGVDEWILDTFEYKQVAKIIVLSFQTGFLVFGSYYVHFKLINKKEFWKEEYWVDALKGITFFALSYLLVVFLKGMLSRPYYYNCIFGDLLEQLRGQGHNDWADYYIAQDHYQYGYNLDGNWADNIPDAWPWYKANGYFHPQPKMPHFPSPTDYAFPSGHLNATYCVGTIFFLILGKQRKFNWVLKSALILFLLHLLSMTFSMAVIRGHWISDLTFSHLWALLLLPIVGLLMDKIIPKKLRNHSSLKAENSKISKD